MTGLNIQKNKVAVIGFGISGKSVARHFLKNAVEVDVYEDKKTEDFDHSQIQDFVLDSNFKIYFSNTTPQTNIEEYDYVIVSPGVPQSHSLIQKAHEAGIEYITDINMFVRAFRIKYPKGKIVSITGSNGKSTTVSLMYEALKATDVDVYLGGNIGMSPLDFIDTIKTENPVVIIETSSYQLEYVTSKDYFDIAGITNISDNHLNRYQGKKELYAKAKLGGISPEYTDVILNFDDDQTQKYVIPQLTTKHVFGIQFESGTDTSGIAFENDSLVHKNKILVPDIHLMNLKGLHNVYNCAFVCAVCILLDIQITQKTIDAIHDFSGLVHRVQYIATVQGVVFINDSKSTSPDATSKALDTLGNKKNIILISGGNDKDISYESMKNEWSDFVKALILLPGTANTKLKALAEESGVELLGEVQTMQEALDIATMSTQEGDMVLLSPATDSHASFKSFEDRGNQFIECVQNLKN